MTMMNGIRQAVDSAAAEDLITWSELRLLHGGYLGFSDVEIGRQELLGLCLMSESPDVRPGENDLDLNSCLNNAKNDEIRAKNYETLLKTRRNKAVTLLARNMVHQKIDQEILSQQHAAQIKAQKWNQMLREFAEIRPLYSGIFTVHSLRYYDNHGALKLGNKDQRTFRMSLETPFLEFLGKLRAEALAFASCENVRHCGYTLEDGPWYYRRFEKEELFDDGQKRKKLANEAFRITSEEDYKEFLRPLLPGDHNKAIFWHAMTPKGPDYDMSNTVATEAPTDKVVAGWPSPLQSVTVAEHKILSNRLTPFDIIEIVLDMETRGAKAFRFGDLELCLEQYQRGLSFMRYINTDTPGASKLCNQIRTVLHLNLTQVFIRLWRFKEAIISSSSALSMPDITDDQKAKAYYHRAVGYSGTWDDIKAVQDLILAFRLAPADVEIRKELDSLEKTLLSHKNPAIRREYELLKGDCAGGYSLKDTESPPRAAGGTLCKPSLTGTFVQCLEKALKESGRRIDDFPKTHRSVLYLARIQLPLRSRAQPGNAKDKLMPAKNQTSTFNSEGFIEAEETGVETFLSRTPGGRINSRKRQRVDERGDLGAVSDSRSTPLKTPKMDVGYILNLEIAKSAEIETSLSKISNRKSESQEQPGKKIMPDYSLEDWIKDIGITKQDEPLDGHGFPYFDRCYNPDTFRLGKHKHESPWVHDATVLD